MTRAFSQSYAFGLKPTTLQLLGAGDSPNITILSEVEFCVWSFEDGIITPLSRWLLSLLGSPQKEKKVEAFASTKRESMKDPLIPSLALQVIESLLPPPFISAPATLCELGREKVRRWNERSALQAMCDAQKHWYERSFRTSGAFGGWQNLPFNNRKSHFLSFFFSQPWTMIKTFFHNPCTQLKMFTSACNLFHSKLAKMSSIWGCRMLALAAKHDMVVFHRLFYKSSKLLHPKSYIF